MLTRNDAVLRVLGHSAMPLSRVEIHGRLPEGLYDRERSRALNQLSSTLNSLAAQGKVLAKKTDHETGVKLWCVPKDAEAGTEAGPEIDPAVDDDDSNPLVVDMEALESYLDIGDKPENRDASSLADIIPARVADFLRAELLAAGATERPVIENLAFKLDTLEHIEGLLAERMASTLREIRDDLRKFSAQS